jgi:histidine kinase/DNA gyrase B/HSP90-like ATPase
LLVLARADAGQSVLLGTVDLEEIVAEAGARVSPRARERDIRLAVEVSGDCAVRGDATWLSQLLLNLLDNALRYTPPGGRVRLGLRPADGGVAVEVADTGSGIGPEHLPHIFDAFIALTPLVPERTAPASDWQSANGLPMRTVVVWRWRASSTVAQPSPCGFPRRRPRPLPPTSLPH